MAVSAVAVPGSSETITTFHINGLIGLTANSVRWPYWNLVAHFTDRNNDPKRGLRLAPNPSMAEPRASSLMFPLLLEQWSGEWRWGGGVEVAFACAGTGVREDEGYSGVCLQP